MKIYTNARRVKQKQQIGLYFSMGGMLLLGLALFLLFQPQYTLAFWVITMAGFLVASIGTYHVNRWLRPPLPEPAMAQAFDRLDARHVLFNHFGLVPHLLLTPKGLIAIKPKRYEGRIFYDALARRWRSPFSVGQLPAMYLRGLTAEGLGNPTDDVARARNDVQAWLQVHLPELAEQVPIEALLLFLSPKALLDATVQNAPLPIAQPATLKKVVQGLLADKKPLSKESYKRLRDALEAQLGPGTLTSE